MSEDEFQEQVMLYAKARGWRCVHFKKVLVNGPRGPYYATPFDGDKGSPDLLLAKNGLRILAELKTDTGKLKPDQRDWLDALGPSDKRTLIVVWRPRDWKQITAALDT